MNNNMFDLDEKDMEKAKEIKERNRLRLQNKIVDKREKVIEQLQQKFFEDLTQGLTKEERKGYELTPAENRDIRDKIETSINDNPTGFGLVPDVLKMVKTKGLYKTEVSYQKNNKEMIQQKNNEEREKRNSKS